MNKQQIDRVIDKAKYLCERSGTRLTEKRRSVLELLLVSNIPLSAYEITDAYNQIDEKPLYAHSALLHTFAWPLLIFAAIHSASHK